MRSLLPVLVLLGCSEQGLVGRQEPNGNPDTDADTDVVVDTDGDTDPGDTDVDPEDCEVTLPGVGTVGVLEECESYDAGSVTDPWDLDIEWTFGTGDYIVMSPVTGNLTDDNGDGAVDENDIPDVAFVSMAYSTHDLFIVSGDGSGLICTAPGFRNDGGVIIADVDGDGENEVVGPTADGHVRAVDGDCVTQWVSPNAYTHLWPVTTAADLDADGDVEVIADASVVSGADGSHVATLAPVDAALWRTPMTGDLDLDGDVEIVLGDSVFDAAGTRLWSAGPNADAISAFNAIVNLDADDEAEVIFSYGSRLYAYEHDGTPIWNVAGAAWNPGPPCAGDIDGDGQVEVIAPMGTTLNAYEHDGKLKWSAPMQDSSGAAGCVVFDMDGDEVYEVLFADEVALRVYDGVTGTALYANADHGSVTYFETPVVADVDRDGSAEMLVVNSSYLWPGLTVYGHAGSGWPAAGPTWGLHDFAESNQLPSGAIPTTPPTPWLDYNISRGRPYATRPGNPDLVVAVSDVCLTSCDADGHVEIAYQVANQGGEDATEAFSVSLYLLDGGAEEFYAAQAHAAVSSGQRAAGGQFDVPIAAYPDEGFVLRVDDDGAGLGVVAECYEDDNDARYEEVFCP